MLFVASQPKFGGRIKVCAMKLSILGCALLLLPCAARAQTLAPARADGAVLVKLPQSVPAGAKVSLEARRADYFLGENIIADFRVENTGQTPFAISVGGDYRGGTRADRFKISARDAEGHLVNDPHPVQLQMGGLGGTPVLQPGQSWTQTLSLLPYCRFETPGQYTVSATHDLGWKPTPERPLPVAQTTISLQMPTPDQARQIVESLEAMPENGGVLWGQKNPQSWPDFGALHFPVYLPILETKIRAGDARYLPAVAGLETPAATEFLIELLDAKPEIAQQAAASLIQRLPLDPTTQQLTFGDDEAIRANQELRRQRVESSWRAEFSAPILDYARRALQSDERPTLRLGAELMQQLGTAPDYPPVMAALERRLQQTALHPRWQYAGDNNGGEDMDGWQLQDDCLDLMRAALQIQKRGAMPPANAVTAAQIAVQIEKMKTEPQRLDAQWQNDDARYLRHPLPFIRQLALESLRPSLNLKVTPTVWLPIQLTPAVRALLPTLLADPDISVRAAAAELAAAARDRTLAPAVLKNLAQTRNNWDAGPANRAARALGVSLGAAQLWARRLNEPKMFHLALDSLVELTTGHGISSSRTDTAQGEIFQPRWEKFLRENAAFLATGKTFAPAQLPRDLYPADWNL